jgi:hypothetical protein
MCGSRNFLQVEQVESRKSVFKLDGIDNRSKSVDIFVGPALKTGEVVELTNAESADELKAAFEGHIPCRPSSSLAT